MGRDFEMDSIKAMVDTAERKYTLGRPARSEEWRNLSFVKYFVNDNGHIAFEKLNIDDVSV